MEWFDLKAAFVILAAFALGFIVAFPLGSRFGAERMLDWLDDKGYLSEHARRLRQDGRS